jgi:hypothetical protein
MKHSKTVSTYLGVWRPGAGEQRWFSGSVAAFQAVDSELFKKGLRLVALDRNISPVFDSAGIHPWPEDRIIGVWRPGSGAQYWATGLSVSQFKAADAKHFADGLRLIAVDTGGGGISAVWRPGSGTQYWASGLNVEEFTAKDATYFAQGLRLTAIDVDDGDFFGVWRSGDGPQRWISTSFEGLKNANIDYMKQGLRLVALDHKSSQFAGVWHAGTGAEYWLTGITVEQFKKADADYFKQGLRLVAVDLSSTVVEYDDGVTSTPGAVSRNLVLHQNGPFGGAGGNSLWMYYNATVPSNDFQHLKTIQKVKNSSNFSIILTHNGTTTELAPHAESDFFDGDGITGYWSAELINVSGPSAPISVALDITL